MRSNKMKLYTCRAQEANMIVAEAGKVAKEIWIHTKEQGGRAGRRPRAKEGKAAQKAAVEDGIIIFLY